MRATRANSFYGYVDLLTTFKSMSVNISQVQVRTDSGSLKKLGDFKGQVLLIVNVASRCGFTKQYGGLHIEENTKFFLIKFCLTIN